MRNRKSKLSKVGSETFVMAKSTKVRQSLLDTDGGQLLHKEGFDVAVTKRITQRTGSFANCTEHFTKKGTPHPDQKYVTIMCQTMSYRMRMPAVASSSQDILIGVLSSAGNDGPSRRASIRDTWGRGNSVYFLVAGPWTTEIASEYEKCQ